MDKSLGKEYASAEARKQFLADNCDAIEKKDYMKQFTPEQMHEIKEDFVEVGKQIKEIEDQKKDAMKAFKVQLDPLIDQRNDLLTNLKNKAELITEQCYKFVDREENMVGFYNAEGDLIDSRPAFQNELQGTIFQLKRTGTNN